MKTILISSDSDEGVLIEGDFNDADLSKMDFGDDTISLYINKEFVTDAYVWNDSEMNKRNYIIINHTMHFLYTLNELY